MVIGETLSHFEVTAKLGEGGMGEVYRATDTKLGREVAIKVLPEAFVADPERLARFEREARVLASLNHPNIASLYEVRQEGGVHFLVMELAAGETLAARMARGPIPVDEAIPIALDIARALEAAHERGIVHRDLKPANVSVSEAGEVKVLDFGLAKALEVEAIPAEGEGLTQSPTLTYQPTVAGVLLGTAAYMSPEQARGRPVDKRADIWAFGVVLWEMLAGRRLFGGESVSDILAAVLREEPPAGALPRDLPRSVRLLLDRCLERDPRQRLRDIGEARIVLVDPGGKPDVVRPAGPGWSAVFGAALAAAALVAGLAWLLRPATAPAPTTSEVRFSFHLPSDSRLDQASVISGPVEVAPDGSFVVFSARAEDGGSRIFRRSIDSLEIVPVEGGEGGRQPFVSPDSRWIGFSTREHGLAKVAATGGVPQRIYDGERLMASGACWGADDRIYFARGLTGGIAAVPASGGEPELLTRPNLEAGEIGHWNPQLLPGGGELLYGALTVKGWRTKVLELATGEIRDIDTDGFQASYVDAGYMLWLDEGDLIAAPFDLGARRLRGEGRTVVSGVSNFHVAPEGTLTYMTHPSLQSVGTVARWSETGGSTVLEGLGKAVQMRVAPGGGRLVVSSDFRLWVVDLDRGVRSPLTTEGLLSNFPAWSPDGTRVVFNSIRAPHGVYIRSVDGVGEARLVLARTTDAVYLPASWSPDGRSVAVTELHADGQADVASIDLDSGARTPLVATEALEHSPAISPDGRWFAYASDVSGRDEVYLRPFVRDGRRLAVSTGGGSEPRWGSDGRTLYFRQGPEIYSVSVTPGEEDLELGVPEMRAELSGFLEPTVPYAPVWDVAPNGDVVYLRVASDEPGGDEIFVVRGLSRELSPSS